MGKKAGAAAVLLVVSCVGLLLIVYKDSIDFHAEGWGIGRALAGSTTTDVVRYVQKGKGFDLGFGHRWQNGYENYNGVDYSLDYLEVSVRASENRYRDSTSSFPTAPDPRVFLNLSLTKRAFRFSASDQRLYVTYEDGYITTPRGFLGLSLPKAQPRVDPVTLDGTLSFSYLPPAASYERGSYYCFWDGINDADCSQRVTTEDVRVGSVGAIKVVASFHCTGAIVSNPPTNVSKQPCQDRCLDINKDPNTWECLPGTVFTECVTYKDTVKGTTCSQGTGKITFSYPNIPPLTYEYTGAPIAPDDYYTFISTTISDDTRVVKTTTTTPAAN